MKRQYRIFFILFACSLLAQDQPQQTPKENLEMIKAPPKVLKSKDGATFTADWRDTELRDFLIGMSAIIRKNILIDDSVKGRKITIISQKRVRVEDAYFFMKSVLEAQGFGLIEENDLIKVVKIKDALAKSQTVRIGKEPISEKDLLDNKTITQIIPLEFSNGAELEPILKRVTSQDTDVIITRNGNTMIFSGSSADINKLLKILGTLDVRGDGPGTIASAGDIHIYTLEYNEAEKLAAILTKLDIPDVESEQVGQDGKPVATIQKATAPGQQKEKIKAVAHKESNSVIVTASAREWKEISRLIKILDLPRKQVLLEVLIVELVASDLNDFGIDWRFQSPTAGNGQFNSGLASQGGIINNQGRITNVNTLSGFSLGFLRRGQEQAVGILNANATNQNFNVLSAPQILTLDNQEAEINVGQDVPVRTQDRNAGLGGDNAVTVSNFEYRPTGIKLKFTPHINKNNKITLDLYQEIKSIAGAQLSGGNPTFNNRNIKTTITVDNVQTIVIGGLINTDKERRITKIPLLGEIPLIGSFFRRTTSSLRKTNLMLFLTPHVLDDRNRADTITIQKKMEQEKLERERDKKLR